MSLTEKDIIRAWKIEAGLDPNQEHRTERFGSPVFFRDEGGQPVGFHRPFKDLEGRQRVGMTFTHPEHRKKGHASAAVKRFLEGTDEPVFARIHPENVASQNTFKSLGFVRHPEMDTNEVHGWIRVPTMKKTSAFKSLLSGFSAELEKLAAERPILGTRTLDGHTFNIEGYMGKGSTWPADYGHHPGYKGLDGDSLDFFMGKRPGQKVHEYIKETRNSASDPWEAKDIKMVAGMTPAEVRAWEQRCGTYFKNDPIKRYRKVAVHDSLGEALKGAKAARLGIIPKEKKAAANFAVKADKHHNAADKNWTEFEKNLKAKGFRAAIALHPESDAKLRRYVLALGNYMTSKDVVGVVPSRSSSKLYKIKRIEGGRLACGCKDWQYKHSHRGTDCEHIKEISQGLEKKSEAIRLVDGQKVRDNIDVDFTMGGNSERYPYVPKGEIWLDKNMNQKDRKATALHEKVEEILMRRGQNYDRAHDQASNVEASFRKVSSLAGGAGIYRSVMNAKKQYDRGKVMQGNVQRLRTGQPIQGLPK